MAIIILPDAQADLFGLQEYMLDKWGEAEWMAAEEAIFDKLQQVDTGNFPGTPIRELASVGIFDYQFVLTSHHKLVFRRWGDDTYVYAIATHRQAFMTLLMRRLLQR